MRTTLVAKLGAMAIAALLLAACGSLGGAGGGAADDYATDSGSQSGNASSGDAGQSDGGYDTGNDYGDDTGGGEAAKGALKVADSDFGQILTDAEGRSLYAFTKDTDGQSTCNAGCEENWPPLLADGKPTGSADVDGALKTVSREDGTKQVVIGKWPLYYFAGDNAPSDTQGQGVNDVWFLVGPDGKLVKS